MDLVSLIAYVRRYAINHYDRSGWDILVECWSDSDIADAIGNARTERGARRACRAALRPIKDYRQDIINA